MKPAESSLWGGGDSTVEDIKHNIQTITIVRIIAIIMLFIALEDNPYGYYQILRWVVCGVAGYSAYLAHINNRIAWTWIFGITAILYNPISTIHLARDTWKVLNAITVVVIFVSIIEIKFNLFRTKLIKDHWWAELFLPIILTLIRINLYFL